GRGSGGERSGGGGERQRHGTSSIGHENVVAGGDQRRGPPVLPWHDERRVCRPATGDGERLDVGCVDRIGMGRAMEAPSTRAPLRRSPPSPPVFPAFLRKHPHPPPPRLAASAAPAAGPASPPP